MVKLEQTLRLRPALCRAKVALFRAAIPEAASLKLPPWGTTKADDSPRHAQRANTEARRAAISLKSWDSENPVS
jgi:hypothetical protein